MTAFIHAGTAHALPRGPRHQSPERLDEAVLRPARVGRTRDHGVHKHCQGTKFLANPDLPARIAAGADLNAPKADLFYTGKVGDLTYTGPEGYTDYPTLTPN